jgi:outer membrane protein insertion porin family
MVVFGSERLFGRALFALAIALAIGSGDLAAQQREPPPQAGEANVVEVRLEGNSTALNKLGFRFATRAGQPFDPKLVEDDVRSLDRTRRFLDIRPKYQRVPGGIVVIFSVVERPMIRKIKYVGNKGIKSKVLEKQAEMKAGEALDPHMIEDARRRIERYYHEKGFAKANVTTLKGSESGEVVFLINEGNKQRVFWTQFEGNTIATDARLRTQIQSKPGILWFIGGYVDPKKIEEDEDRITAYYRSLGFFQANVGRLLDYDEDREWLTITYVVNEGIRYKVRNVSVMGNQKFPTEDIASKLEMKGGEYFDQAKLRGDENYIRDLYGGQGHIFADVQADTRFVEEPGQEGLVDLVYNIGEGDRYRVGRIYVRINGDYPHTKQRTIINRLSLRSGDIVDTRLLRADEVRLKRSGLFINDPTKGQVPKIAIIPPEGMEDGEQLAKRPRGSTAGRAPASRGFRGQSPDTVWPREHQASKPAARRGVVGNAAVDVIVDGQIDPQGPWQAEESSSGAPAKYRAQDAGYGGARIGATGPTAQPVSHSRPSGGAQQTVYYDTSMASASGTTDNSTGTTSTQWKQPGARETAAGRGASPSDGARYFDPRVTPAQFAPWPPGNANYLPPNATNASPPINYAPPGGNIAPNNVGPIGGPAYVGTPAPAAGPGVVVQPNAVVLPDGITPDGVGYQVFPGNEPAIDLEAVVTEAQTGRLMFGVGVNSNAGLIGNIVLDEQNFDITKFPTSWEDFRNGTAWRGAGQRFRVEAAPGTSVSRYAVSFQEPYLFDRPVSFGISGSYYERFFRDWHEERATGRLSFGYQFPYRPDLSLTTGLRVEEVTITDPAFPTPPELLEVLGSNSVFGVKVGLLHDTRDSPFLPTEGFMHSFEFEQVFGSFVYPRFIIEASRYFTITQRPDGSGRHVLKVGGEFGVTGEDTPIYDRFFAGGFNTLRGWKFRGASPRTFGVAVGGQLELLGTVEYMFPITADDMLRGVVFSDFGTVEREIELEGDNFRMAPGFGLRITVPALGPAPLAFDFAFPILEAPGDENQVFAFFVGINR